MEIGLRILALVIDIIFCMSINPFVISGINLVLEKSGGAGALLLPVLTVLSFVWPVLYLAVPTGIWGKSLGKWICRVKVTDVHGDVPGIWRATGRSVLKILALGSGIGIMLAAFQVLYQGGTWYDHLCGTEVEFDPYVRLTKTQKNWRKQMKQR